MDTNPVRDSVRKALADEPHTHDLRQGWAAMVAIVVVAVAAWWAWSRFRAGFTRAEAESAAPTVAGRRIEDEGLVRQVQADVRRRAADCRVTADQLQAAYDANAVAADRRYKGVPLTVTGIVDEVGTDVLDHDYVTLRAGDGPGVQCICEPGHRDRLARLRRGDSATLIGVGAGRLLAVRVHAALLP